MTGRGVDDLCYPIDTSQAQRKSGRTGVGTPGTGIGEDGDPSPALGAQRATPAIVQVFFAKTHSPTGPDDIELWSEADVARTVTGAEAHRPNQAIYVKAARASHAWNVDKGTVESWKPTDVSATLNVNDNTGDTRATVLKIDAPLNETGCDCCPNDPKPDSARYRACGNAVSVPVIEWIGHRLLTAHEG